MVRIETPLLQLAVVRLCLRGEGKKPPEELVSAGFLAVLEQRLGMIGVFNILETIIAARMAGNELVAPIEAEPVRIGFEGEELAGVVGGDGIAVGL